MLHSHTECSPIPCPQGGLKNLDNPMHISSVFPEDVWGGLSEPTERQGHRGSRCCSACFLVAPIRGRWSQDVGVCGGRGRCSKEGAAGWRRPCRVAHSRSLLHGPPPPLASQWAALCLTLRRAPSRPSCLHVSLRPNTNQEPGGNGPLAARAAPPVCSPAAPVVVASASSLLRPAPHMPRGQPRVGIAEPRTRPSAMRT